MANQFASTQVLEIALNDEYEEGANRLIGYGFMFYVLLLLVWVVSEGVKLP